jgi:hypothetical protein
MIDSINPLRVLGGIAPFNDLIMHTIVWETEYETVEFAKNIDREKMIELIKNSIFISYRDRLQMMTPPGTEIELWKPTEEEIEFQKKLLSILTENLKNK